jgi:hypothetical protein
MTPSVALRSLNSQIHTYRTREIVDPEIDLFMHFDGPITPPYQGLRRPVGDAVFDTIANYASMIAGRDGLLVSHSPGDSPIVLDVADRSARGMFALEHALAIDLARTYPDALLKDREAAARATLGLAAYWCDRLKLNGLSETCAHNLLGTRPDDAIGIVLFDFAEAAIRQRYADLGLPPIIELVVHETD